MLGKVVFLDPKKPKITVTGSDQDTKCGPLLMLGSGLGLLFAN